MQQTFNYVVLLLFHLAPWNVQHLSDCRNVFRAPQSICMAALKPYRSPADTHYRPIVAAAGIMSTDKLRSAYVVYQAVTSCSLFTHPHESRLPNSLQPK